MLRVMQWNARSAVSNKNSLTDFLVKNDIDVALISETWYKPTQAVTFRGYNIVRRDRADGKAGVAILVKKAFSLAKFPYRPILIKIFLYVA
ncbi:unnamed protein product [Callosobruchus maculatus]|uniref:Endonuclease/exonuclease/phosphatase domain-containing protein n=1 Tax=Callosobruchus maculatus TaxID=64391 RepID=A0A653D316_CALMS|nr:unnamed protein product [Callosobruchus maculatus]